MKKYLLAFIYSILIILIGSLLISILYYFNITTDKINNILIYLTSITAIFIGSFKLGKELKYKGIITGAMYFFILLIFFIIISLLIFKINYSISNIIFYLILLIFSILGSIIGKNYQTKNDVI